MTHEQARQTLRCGATVFKLTEALRTLIRDRSSALEDITLALDHKGFVAEQAAFALYERTNTPLPDDGTKLIVDRQAWLQRIGSLGDAAPPTQTARADTSSGNR